MEWWWWTWGVSFWQGVFVGGGGDAEVRWVSDVRREKALGRVCRFGILWMGFVVGEAWCFCC